MQALREEVSRKRKNVKDPEREKGGSGAGENQPWHPCRLRLWFEPDLLNDPPHPSTKKKNRDLVLWATGGIILGQSQLKVDLP